VGLPAVGAVFYEQTAPPDRARKGFLRRRRHPIFKARRKKEAYEVLFCALLCLSSIGGRMTGTVFGDYLALCQLVESPLALKDATRERPQYGLS
jgi:hypothetical protein